MEVIIFLYLSIIFFVLPLVFSGLKNGPKNLPPGKMGWPIIGETIDFMRARRKGTLENFFTDRMIRHSSKVFKTSVGTHQMVILCGAAGNKFLFSNETKLVTPWLPSTARKIIFPSSNSCNDEELLRARLLVHRFLKPEALQTYTGTMDAIAKQQMDTTWGSNQQVIVYPLVRSYAFRVGCRLYMSVLDPGQIETLGGEFYSLVAGLLSAPINIPGTTFNRAIKASKSIRKEIEAIIRRRKIDLSEKKVSPTQDLLSHLLTTANEDGQFVEEVDIANLIAGLLLAGHDTSSSCLAFTMKYMAEHPNVYNEVLKEQTEIANAKAPGEWLTWDDVQKMKYSWNVASEAMRLIPPAAGAFREAISNFDYDGYSIPKGWKLYWSASTTHRSPEYFPDPDKFDPSRFEGNGPLPYTYVPFGGGPRMCPGKEFARLQILAFMHNVVRRFKWEKVIDDEKVEFDPIARPSHGLPLLLYPH